MVNLMGKVGQHIVDAGPTYFFRAPLLPGQSAFLSGIEFGCEAAYLEAVGSSPRRASTYEGHAAASQDATKGNERITFTTDAATARPLATTFLRGNQIILTVRYLEYRDDLPIDLARFTRPEGITFQTAK